MRTVTQKLETKTINGVLIQMVRNFFFYDKPRDHFKETHKEFSKEEKKTAKINHKLYLKQ